MIEQILNDCTVDGNLVRLPSVQLDRDVYVKVADKLKKIGGKWKGGKVQAFVFDHDPSDLLADIQDGKTRNIKKEFQFFETPARLANQLVELAALQVGHFVLEPSAGRGAIIREIPTNFIAHYFEINPLCDSSLNAFHNAKRCGYDFLQADESHQFDRIIANPPFSNNQDIDHIRKMYEVLKPGGRIVSIASTHWQIGQEKKASEFRGWLYNQFHEVHQLEPGTFKESGTNVGATVIVIDKE